MVAGATAAPADREALRPAAARRDGALLPSSRAACSMDVVGAEALAEAATMRPAREASPHCLPRDGRFPAWIDLQVASRILDRRL